MEKYKLIEWFYEKFNSCYPVIHQDYPHKIYLFYDKQFIRKMKLCKINNTELTFPSKISGDCLFELDFKYEYIWCSNDKIWSFLESNYNNYQEIKSFIKDRLQDDTKLRVLTPLPILQALLPQLQDDTKMRVLTPIDQNSHYFYLLQDDTKMGVLIPKGSFC